MQLKCTICHNGMEPLDNNAVTPCGHLFHFACLTNWLHNSQTCPQCRGVCTPASTHQIFFNLDIDVADVDKSYQEIKQSITALNASLPGTVEKILNSVVKKIEDGQLKRSLTNINLEFKEEMKLVKHGVDQFSKTLSTDDTYKKRCIGLQNLVVSLRKNILEKDNYIEKIREELDTYGLVDNSGFDPEDDEFQGNSFANPKISKKTHGPKPSTSSKINDIELDDEPNYYDENSFGDDFEYHDCTNPPKTDAATEIKSLKKERIEMINMHAVEIADLKTEIDELHTTKQCLIEDNSELTSQVEFYKTLLEE